jgi:NADH-quinone oxidoreductase subunit M
MPYLTLLLAIPLIGATSIAVLPTRRERLIRGVAIAHATVVLVLTWGLTVLFDPFSAELQLVEFYHWNPRLGTHYALGIDGFSYPMVLLITLLSLMAILVSGSVKNKVKSYYLLMLVLEMVIILLDQPHGRRAAEHRCLDQRHLCYSHRGPLIHRTRRSLYAKHRRT